MLLFTAEEMGGIYAKFGELVKESDFILPMCNLTDKTRGLFNKRVFDLMKPTAIFINTSRFVKILCKFKIITSIHKMNEGTASENI